MIILHLFLIWILSRLKAKLTSISLIIDLECLNHIDSNGTQIPIHQRHASLLSSRYKKGTAATITVAIMLTRHPITPVNRAKHIAGKLCWLNSFQMLLILLCDWLRYECS